MQAKETALFSRALTFHHKLGERSENHLVAVPRTGPRPIHHEYHTVQCVL